MARSLDEIELDDDSGFDRLLDPRRLDRSAARSIAAAISSLLITTLVVSQSASALQPEGTIAGNSFAAGTITLVDDDQGRSLVNLADMAPGRPVEECINVEYTGSILPVDLSLATTATGPLAEFMTVEVEVGDNAGFESCDDFVPESVLFSGTLSQLASQGPRDVRSFRNTGDSASFRFEFAVLDDGRAVGAAAAVDFVWEVVPG